MADVLLRLSERRGGTVSVSWGSYGGFYLHRHRVCLGWIALTYTPVDLDALMRAYVELHEQKTPCPLCADLGMTLYHGEGETATLRSCSMCGTGLPIAPTEVPNEYGGDDDGR